ncbi:MAG: hypothetical protein ACE10G_11200 [Gemmatimonadales bacterium]
MLRSLRSTVRRLIRPGNGTPVPDSSRDPRRESRAAHSARRVVYALFRRRFGSTVWDGVLRGSGIIVLLGIAVLKYMPAAGPLVGFVLVTIWINGPAAFLFPAVYEPILMLFGRMYPPLLIGCLGTCGTLYVEYLNYHLYRRVLHADALAPFRSRRLVQYVTALFRKMPFFTVWLCSLLLPYWPVRIVSPLAGYAVRRHLSATLLGRFPRLWFFAALGASLHVDPRVLLGISAAFMGSALILILFRRALPAAVGRNRVIEGSVEK